jgi:hypothetical protein
MFLQNGVSYFGQLPGQAVQLLGFPKGSAAHITGACMGRLNSWGSSILSLYIAVFSPHQSIGAGLIFIALWNSKGTCFKKESQVESILLFVPFPSVMITL